MSDLDALEQAARADEPMEDSDMAAIRAAYQAWMADDGQYAATMFSGFRAGYRAAVREADALDVARLAKALHRSRHSHWLASQVTEGHLLGEQEDARIIAAAYAALLATEPAE